MQQVGDKVGEGATLNNIAMIFESQGDYKTALFYLNQALSVVQQSGDKMRLCDVLINIGFAYMKNNQIQEAASAWVTVYVIARKNNLDEVLDALAKFAPRLGLPEGLEGWEMLAQRAQSGEIGQIKQFIHTVMEAARSNSAEVGQYFEVVSKMAMDSNVPSYERELGKVLQRFMSGVKNPDLGGLPEEIREIVQEELKM